MYAFALAPVFAKRSKAFRSSLSKSLCSMLEYDKLLEAILYTTMCQVHTLGAGIFVLKDIASEQFELGNISKDTYEKICYKNVQNIFGI